MFFIERKVKVFTVNKDSPSRVTVFHDSVKIVGDKYNFLTVSKGLVGINSNKLVIKAAPENIIKGIIFKENLGFAQTVPSTAATPIPNLLMNIPGAGLIANISKGTPGLAIMNFLG